MSLFKQSKDNELAKNIAALNNTLMVTNNGIHNLITLLSGVDVSYGSGGCGGQGCCKNKETYKGQGEAWTKTEDETEGGC